MGPIGTERFENVWKYEKYSTVSWRLLVSKKKNMCCGGFRGVVLKCRGDSLKTHGGFNCFLNKDTLH